MKTVKWLFVLLFNLLYAYLVYRVADGNFLIIYLCGAGSLGLSIFILDCFEFQIGTLQKPEDRK